MKRRKAPPDLTSAVVEDVARLDEAIDEILRGDRELRDHGARITEAQKELRVYATVDGWACYLTVEELSNARLAAALRLVARRAFDAGVRTRATRRR